MVRCSGSITIPKKFPYYNKLCINLKFEVISFFDLEDIRNFKATCKEHYVLVCWDKKLWYRMCNRLGYNEIRLNIVSSNSFKLGFKSILRYIINKKGWRWIYLSKTYNTMNGCFRGIKNKDITTITGCVRRHSHNKCRCNKKSNFSIGFHDNFDTKEMYEGEWRQNYGQAPKKNGFGILHDYGSYSKYSYSVYIGKFRNGKKNGKGMLWISHETGLHIDYKNNNFPNLNYTFSKLIKGIWKSNKIHGFADVINLALGTSERAFFYHGKRWKQREIDKYLKNERIDRD